jgi:hypothetical protein
VLSLRPRLGFSGGGNKELVNVDFQETTVNLGAVDEHAAGQ